MIAPREWLSVVVPPAALPVTVAAAKLHLAVSHDSHDAMIERLIGAATNAVEARSGRALCLRTIELRLSRFPPRISLPWPPFRDVLSAVYFDASGVQTTMVEGVDFQVIDGGRLGRSIIRTIDGASWPTVDTDEPQPVRITYRAGFPPDGDSPTNFAASVPDEFVQAILMAVASWYATRGESALPAPAAALVDEWTDWSFS